MNYSKKPAVSRDFSRYFKIALILCMIMLSLSVLGCNKSNDDEQLLRLIVPSSWELEVGDSRTVDFSAASSVTDRNLTWKATPKAVASVDSWGRVTALAKGVAVVTATTASGLSDSVVLTVVETSDVRYQSTQKVDYSGNAVTLGGNLQKVVTRYANSVAASSEAVPEAIKALLSAGNPNYTALQSQTTTDGAVWRITDYGVLRTETGAANSRDVEQRFMGDRYFYETNTTTGKVLAIMSDGTTGIWTVMATGVTHIEMLDVSGTEKAAMMASQAQEFVSRHGFISESYYDGDGDRSDGNNWKGNESDNDGLWTSMYAVGELMRFASLKADSSATYEEIAAARKSALISTEAVLLLSNISMRTGTVEAYVRYQPNGRTDENPYGTDTANGRYLSQDALKKDGDSSLNIPAISPSDAFSAAYEAYLADGTRLYVLSDNYLAPYSEEDWSNPVTNSDGSVTYETRTRNLEGFISRTYSFDDEGNAVDGYIHWDFTYDGDGKLVAVGVSSKNATEKGYYLNGENLRGVTADASGSFPTRLWNDLVAAGEISSTATIDQLTYKGDTSSDEIIGHLFLWKVAYDVLGSEDAEIKQIISDTADRFAQHITDNGYMMVDGTGQPDTWSKFNRAFFYNSSQLGGAPLTAAVCLCIFKVAYYVTGNVKWQNEYLMAALDPSYEYAELMTQYSEQCYLYMMLLVDEYAEEYGINKSILDTLNADMSFGSAFSEGLTRLFLNYSDEEMAMLAFYLLFQLETNETLLDYYREAIDDWWVSIKYSENPLWYYIYQLAYPDKTITDAYGNNILETAAWSLSRHPIDTTQYLASNTKRDDVAEFDLGIGDGSVLCYAVGENGATDYSGFQGILKAITGLGDIDWAVAAPDERSLHKYNGCSYNLDGNHNVNCREGSTTYTLPYWLGIYHGMLSDN